MADETATETTESTAPAATPAWRAGLPPELASEKAWDDIKGDTWEQAGPVIAKRFLDTQKLVGNSVRIPKPDASPEEHAKFRAAIGVPETPDKYGIELPPLPDGVPGWKQERVSAALTRLHAKGAPPELVREALDIYAGLAIEDHNARLNATTAAKQAAVEALTKKWGPAGSATFRNNLGLALGAVAKLFPEGTELRAMAEDHGNNPELVQILAAVGAQFQEDRPLDPAEHDALAQDAVQAKLDAMENDPNHPVNDAMHPRHEEALKERLELYRRRPGGRAPALSTA